MTKHYEEYPEDFFIDRYMPGASAVEREAARQNVRNLISVLIRINDRLRREAEGDSPKGKIHGRFHE
ncbi:MAG: hypothetical protein JST16_04965 [Bdellovibrionales bacterium]|nr:hypothetical protein [Bdellovibrionales bacterium]